VNVRSVDLGDKFEWLRMRASLWPESRADHEAEIDEFLSSEMRTDLVLVADREDGHLGGFLEAGTRPYAEGCRSTPVGYIEGWWVDPDLRQSGVGALLVAAAEAWARSRGLVEMASDVQVANEASQAAHRAIGYAEVESIVCFRKEL
jgi:aminoglycoside 6'-N-acetyltransferase I